MYNYKLLSKRQFENLSPELKEKIRYGIVIDAGSSGSRIQIYSWIDTDYLIEKINNKEENIYKDLITSDGLPVIKQGSSSDDFDGQLKLEEGISTFVDRLNELGPSHVKLLLDYAETKIPKEKFEDTEVYLFATAGMRLLTLDQQQKILDEIYNYMKDNYKFKIKDKETSIRVITGEEEGLFGWISTNYLEHGFSLNKETKERQTYNFVDMGGASTQIAFELDRKVKINGKSVDALENAKSNKSNKNIIPLNINNLYGDSLDFNVFVITFLQYGVNETRRRYLEAFLNEKRKDENYQKLLKESKTKTGNKLLELKKRDEEVQNENIIDNRIFKKETKKDGKEKRGKNKDKDGDKKDDKKDDKKESKEDKDKLSNITKPIDPDTEDKESPVKKPIDPDTEDKKSPVTKPLDPDTEDKESPIKKPIEPEDEKDKIVWEDPCLPVNARQDIIRPVDYISLYGEEEGEFIEKNVIIKGVGHYDECAKNIYPLLNSTVPCTSDSCLFNNIYSPYTTFDDEKFLAIGKYWDVVNVYNQAGLYDYHNFLNSSREFCKTEWSLHLNDYNDGKYPALRKPYDLALNCFRSAYIENILHQGYKIPKDDNKAIPFNTICYVNGTEASWALGALIEQISDKIGTHNSFGIKKASPAAISSNFISTAFNLSISAVIIIAVAGVVLYRQRKNTPHEMIPEEVPLNDIRVEDHQDTELDDFTENELLSMDLNEEEMDEILQEIEEDASNQDLI